MIKVVVNPFMKDDEPPTLMCSKAWFARLRGMPDSNEVDVVHRLEVLVRDAKDRGKRDE